MIPYFNAEREQYLEYDISSLIYRLSAPEKPVLGILSTLPLDTGAGGMAAALQGQAQPYAIYTELTQTFTTQMLDPSINRIPANVAVLMVVHPAGGLSAAAQYAIDQFVLKGGRALVFVDPNSELAAAGAGMDPRGGAQPASDLPRLLAAWGVGYNPGKVIADRDLAQRVQVSSDPRNPVASYPIWLHLGAAQFNATDMVTANLQALNLASAGALHALKSATTTSTPLVKSSELAMLVDSEEVRFNPRAAGFDGADPADGENFVIAARVSAPRRPRSPTGRQRR